MVKLAEGKEINDQTVAMDMIKELVGMETGLTNLEVFEKIIAEHKQMNKEYDFPVKNGFEAGDGAQKVW